jgi:outer membrane protein
VPVYQWALSEDLQPMRDCVSALVAGKIDVVLFMTAVQIIHLFEVAEQMALREELTRALRSIVVLSIGPTTPEELAHYRIQPDFEPSRSKMVFGVNEAAQYSRRLLDDRRNKKIEAVPYLRVLGILFLSCVAFAPTWAQHAPDSAEAPWQPAHNIFVSGPLTLDSHEVLLEDQSLYTLGQLIDIAESNNPSTHAAWERARVAAASLGIAKSELYPTVLAAAGGRTFKNVPLLYSSFALQDISAFETALTLNYTLVDFGARRDEIASAQARLLTANLNFNNEHLILIQKVSSAYYTLLNATGLRKAAEVNLQDAEAVESAVLERKANGLATLPNVLEARAAAAKADYDLQCALGAEQTAFGDLATILTASPSKSFKVQELEEIAIPEALDQNVEDAIESAYKTRPDLLADIERVRAADADIKSARSAYLPKLEFDGSKGWLRAWGQQEGFGGTYGKTYTYDARLSLTWTVFDGFKRESRLAQAKAERAAAEQEVKEQEDKIADHVWSAYANAVTALHQRKAATSLLNASTESYSAAVESYKDGVRNILDVLSAERELARARAVDVTARTQVLQTFMSLAFRTGDLLTQHPKGKNP